MVKPVEIKREYFQHYYDINENIYEIISISIERNEVILSNINDGTHITCKLEDFDFEDYSIYDGGYIKWIS